MTWVTNLQQAYDAYWASTNRREHQAAYHEILLFGGKDGYCSGWRSVLARWLRMAALWLDRNQ